MKLLCNLILTITVTAVVFACQSPKNPTALEILTNFREDEAAAVEKYLDKQLIVDVPVQMMIQNRDGGLTILYTDYKTDYSIQFNVSPKQLPSAKNLKTNTIARISGKCADGGKNRDIVLTDCKVIE